MATLAATMAPASGAFCRARTADTVFPVSPLFYFAIIWFTGLPLSRAVRRENGRCPNPFGSHARDPPLERASGP